MIFGKLELIRRLSDYIRKGWTNQQVKDLIDSLWRDPCSPRTSGFDIAGGLDSQMMVQVDSFIVNGQEFTEMGFTIGPMVKCFKYYQYRNILTLHKIYDFDTISITAKEGLQVIYYDADPGTKKQILRSIFNPTREDLSDIIQWSVLVAFLYYDAEEGKVTYFGDNRHGSLWNPWIHWSWHQTFNSMRESGLHLTDLIADADGSENAHAQFGISEGTCFHEDIYATSEAKPAPANVPVWYFKSAQNPRIHKQSVNSLVVDGTLCYNAAGSSIPADTGYYVMYHIFFTNDTLEPLISVMGQAQYEKVSTASLMVDTEIQQVKDQLPHQNMLHVGTLLFQTSPLFLNSYHSRLVCQAFGVITAMSITGDGSKSTPVKLVNDNIAPGANKVYRTNSSGVKGWADFPIPETADKDNVIEFGFKDVLAGSANSYDMDINCEFPYTIIHIWLRTDSGTLTGVNVKINAAAVTGLQNISVSASKSKSIASAANAVVADDLVTLNITTAYTGAPTYIGGHIYIERS